jgi:thiamine-monophosphate kinase
MHEVDIIRSIATRFPRAREQMNALFESDAELIRMGNATWGLTMDDFSPEEDLFSADDPARLGANLAVATLSDLLAVGAEPRFFMHALALPALVPPAFLAALCDGIASILDQAECSLCGGDTGCADPWRYCGFAMGPVTAATPLTRRLPARPQTLWITGTLGDANLAALTGAPTPAFEPRLREAAAIRRHATACMDTSGGLMDAVWIMHVLNPALRFDIHADKIPFAPAVAAAAATAGLPSGAALLGGAGEYELLFAAPADLRADAARELLELGSTPIGTAAPDAAPGVRIVHDGRPAVPMTTPPPCARAAASTADHIRAVARAAAVLFGGVP